ncbi:hypothetical protein P3T36_002973 [Kitasatospora sp. MAP12-15]|uniref:hypothetical protein n=1 Tax=unclassified Kitasatospora TaxID=2633591 RepID=UPI002475C9C9|nr:hypothetical protein [Kitasatospora sp. MAP12-44]MDH6108842.1 hypothetical protein [Kitasatospora sp. MAP12-44]
MATDLLTRTSWTQGALHVRPSKRVEMIDSAKGEEEAKGLWLMWAGLITKAGWAERFGVSMKHMGYGNYGIYLTDRTKSE